MAKFISWILKISLFFLFHPGTNPTESGGYPPLWNLVPESLEDFAILNNKTVINPWSYRERMGMYKILLNVTAQSMAMFGIHNTGNVLWGLPLQHGWQFQTGRVADPTKDSATKDRGSISVKSWWACMNYYLAVIPFLGAVDAGFFEDWPYEIQILPPEEHGEDFCYTTADCQLSSPDAMDKWVNFFKCLQTSRYNSNDKVEPSMSSEEDKYLYYMWIAHVASIEAALPKFKERLKYFSSAEGQFGVNWANAVEFIAATHFPTNFKETNQFQSFLPQRMLVEGDKAPYIPDMSAGENRVLLVLDWINKGNKITAVGHSNSRNETIHCLLFSASKTAKDSRLFHSEKKIGSSDLNVQMVKHISVSYPNKNFIRTISEKYNNPAMGVSVAILVPEWQRVPRPAGDVYMVLAL
ncbi:protein LEG1 homolog [Latimeria chalumnae]|uniref:protein LEG1 homolog n=1 Tax=Latimeria chalumnae TaxID=7897 RepID=UPI00313ECFDB